MASRFTAMFQGVISRNDALFAEETRIGQIPKGAKRGFISVPRVENPNAVPAIVAFGAGEAFMRGARSNMQDRADVEIPFGTVTYSLEALTKAGIALAQGDEVRLPGRPGAPVFEISDIDDEGSGRLVATIKFLKDTA